MPKSRPTVVPIFEPLENRRLLAADASGFSLRVNFQPAGAPTPAGYVADTGLAFGERGNGRQFGWDSDNAALARDRNSSKSPDQRYDTLNHFDYGGLHTWEAAVPDGEYEVRAVAGDPSFSASDYRLNAEGRPLIRGESTPAAAWIDRTVRVTVTDGRLTVDSDGGDGNKLAFIEIKSVGATPDPTPPPTGGPFGGSAVSLPGTVEAENYDLGGFGDTTPQNKGGSGYRNDAVDVQDSSSASNGRLVGYVAAGEWLDYTVNVPAAGTYDLAVRTASNNRGGTFHVEVDGADATGPMVLTNTGGWENWKDVKKAGLKLTAGPHTLRLKIDSAVDGGDVGNFDSLTFRTAAATPAPDGAVVNWPAHFDALADNPQRRFEPVGFTLGGKLYVMGGWQHWTGTLWESSKRSDVYDPATNRWTQLGDIQAPETHAGVAVDEARGDVYFVAGERGPSRGQEIVSEVWKYHAATDAWTRLPVDLPEVRTGGEAALVGRTLHYFGGNPADRETNLGDHWAMDVDHPERGWTRLATQPQSRDHQSAVVLDGQIYAVGGEFGHDILQDQQRIAQRYDPATDAWTRLADAPTAKSHTETATFVYKGKIVSAGGQTAGQLSTPQVVQYDPATDAWTVIGTLPWKLQGTVIQPIGDKVYVSTGGLNNAGDPQKATWAGQLSIKGAAPAPAPTPTPTPSRGPFGGRPISLPATVEAENYDLGGFYDTTAANKGGSNYRNDAVDVQDDSSAGNGRHLGYLAAGEWLDYTVTVPSAGTYDLAVRVASNNRGGGFHVEVDGANATGPMVLPNTGGWQNWKVLTRGGIKLTAGTHVVRLRIDSAVDGGDVGNIDWLKFTPAATAPTPTPAPTAASKINWASAAAPPISYTESESAVVNGKLYVFGGFNGSFRAQKESYSYDPAAGKWTRIADLPSRLTQAGVAVDGANVYFAGGYNGNQTADGQGAPGQVFGSKLVWVYNTATNAYKQTVPLPVERAVGALVRVGRTLHYFGGADLGRRDAADHWVLDLDRPTAWTRAAPMPVATNHFAALEHGGKIYVFGGQQGYDARLTPLATVQIYDPGTGRWTLGRDLPEPRSHATFSTFESGGFAYILGGHREHNAAKSTVYRYDFAADRWGALNDLPDKRISPIAGVVGGKVLLAGGYDGVVKGGAFLGSFVV